MTGDHVYIFLNHDGQFGLEQLPDLADFVPARTGEDDKIPVGATPRQIAVADLNGDGHLDLVVKGSMSGDATILMGDGQGHFAPKQTVSAAGQPPTVSGPINWRSTIGPARR